MRIRKAWRVEKEGEEKEGEGEEEEEGEVEEDGEAEGRRRRGWWPTKGRSGANSEHNRTGQGSGQQFRGAPRWDRN